MKRLRRASVGETGRRLRVFAALAVALLAALGCSSTGARRTPQRNSPYDRLQHKLSRAQEYEGRLTPAQKSILMHHPGRTREDLDRAIEQMLEANERLQSAAEARVEIGDRVPAHGAESPYTIETDESVGNVAPADGSAALPPVEPPEDASEESDSGEVDSSDS